MNNLFYDDYLFGNYLTMTFNDIYPSYEEFNADFTAYSSLGLDPKIDSSLIMTTYYMISAKYGNSHIRNTDLTQFKLKLFTTIFQYAPSWAKSLTIQETLRSLTDEDLMIGNSTINNHSYNPGTAPTTATINELTTIDDQYVSKQKRGKVESLAAQLSLLEKDVTQPYLDKFKPLFDPIAAPNSPLYYITPEENN